MVTFGMGISIPKDELDHAHELAEVAYLNLGLTNDLYSYQKERDTATALGQDHVTNVIWVLMQEHQISEDGAKEMCREKIKQTIVDFRQIVREANGRTDLSNDTKRYLEGLLYSLSGNLVWSIECPRYHPHIKYNERQLDWMKNGIPKDDTNEIKTAAYKNGTSAAIADKEATPTTNGQHKPADAAASLVNVFATYQSFDGLTKLHDDVRSDSVLDGQMNGKHASTELHPIQDHATRELAGSKVVLAPYEYVSSLPSKQIRELAIDSLNVWYQVGEQELERIKTITELLHNASLM